MGIDSSLDIYLMHVANDQSKAALAETPITARLSYADGDPRDTNAKTANNVCKFFQNKGFCGKVCDRLHLCMACISSGKSGMHNPGSAKTACTGGRDHGGAGSKRNRESTSTIARGGARTSYAGALRGARGRRRPDSLNQRWTAPWPPTSTEVDEMPPLLGQPTRPGL